MNRIVSMIALVAVATGCASSTSIRSYPAGATIRSVSGSVAGVTPYQHSDTNMNGHTETFAIEKEGFETEYVTIRRDQTNGTRMAAGVVGGLLVWPVFGTLLWVNDYRPEYVVRLKELPPQEVSDQDDADEDVEEAPKKRAAKKSRVSRR